MEATSAPRSDADWRLRELVAEGATLPEAATELGVGVRWTSRRARALGVPFRRGFPPDPARLSRVVGLVSLGFNTAGKLAPVLGVCQDAANDSVRHLVATGVLVRVGRNRGQRLVVARRWTAGDDAGEHGGRSAE